MAAIWMEARCGSVCGVNGPNWQMPETCHETVRDGGFFRRVREAHQHFRAQGWKEFDDEWWCPVCARILNP